MTEKNVELQEGRVMIDTEKEKKKALINRIDFYPLGFSLCMNCNFRLYFQN